MCGPAASHRSQTLEFFQPALLNFGTSSLSGGLLRRARFAFYLIQTEKYSSVLLPKSTAFFYQRNVERSVLRDCVPVFMEMRLIPNASILLTL